MTPLKFSNALADLSSVSSNQPIGTDLYADSAPFNGIFSKRLVRYHRPFGGHGVTSPRTNHVEKTNSAISPLIVLSLIFIQQFTMMVNAEPEKKKLLIKMLEEDSWSVAEEIHYQSR